MSEKDGDDIAALELLLAAEESSEDEESPNERTAADIDGAPRKLVESDAFAQALLEKTETERAPEKAAPSARSLVHDGDTDSSDDEDRRNCFERKYDDYGSSVKRMIETKEREKISFARSPKKVISRPAPAPVPAPATRPKTSEDVFSDPVFGLRIRNPLVSGAVLLERMRGREAVPLSAMRRHVSGGDLNKDWVTAGVIVRKSAPKESQKGSAYCIWTLSDLRGDLKTVALFLFRGAFKDLRKHSEGTVVGVLNPNVLDRSDKSADEACLSVDNGQKVMVLGDSKDYGLCKSTKKNGERCTSFVNVNACPYCVYHVQKEYGKHSRRSDLQTGPAAGQGLLNLRNKVLGKDTVIYGGKAFTSVPVGRSAGKTSAKDQNRLKSLSEHFKREENAVVRAPPVKKASQIELDRKQRIKDLQRLEMLKGGSEDGGQNSPPVEHTPVASPKLNGFGLKREGKINLCVSFGDKQKIRAKMNAKKWIERNGPLNRSNPNSLRGTDNGKKRILNQLKEENGDAVEDADEKPSKKPKTGVFSERFLKLLETSSSHSDLVAKHDDSEQEKYFKKLEMKEAMEEKMLNTFKVPCKGVKCLKCDYVSFSAAEKCRQEKHPLKVFDTFKRFFKCGNCGNRTTCLELLPLHSCKNCQSSKWQRAAMIGEKKGVTVADTLSIRGEEEKFLGSGVRSGANINLLVPE